MKIETVRRLFLTQAEKNILEKARNLCDLIHETDESSEDWCYEAFDASAAIDDLLDQAELEEEN